MIKWFSISTDRQSTIIQQASARLGIPAYAVEKDVWVSILLQTIFSLPWSDQLLFKGGTSLSKGHDIIKRFSEDIDIAIQREHLGYSGSLSNTQVDKLRKEVYRFCHNDFFIELQSSLQHGPIPTELYNLKKENKDTQKGPASLILEYQSVLANTNSYVQPRVLIELSGRGLKDPQEVLNLNTMIATAFPDVDEASVPSQIPTIHPQRTFLEKIFLLHEEFAKPIEKINSSRRSRHLYDVVEIHKRYGSSIWDQTLFDITRKHRQKYTPIKGVEYESLSLSELNFIPERQAAVLFEEDYQEMRTHMIYDPDAATWDQILESLHKIRSEIA